MKRRKFSIIVLILLAMFPSQSICADTHVKRRQTSIPECARLLNVKVGSSTMEELEKQLGPGQPYTGGHPQGARAWHLRHQTVYINADGFDYNRRGRVVEEITLASEQWLNGIRHRQTKRDLNPRELALFGTITLGMKQEDAVRIATQKLGAGSKDGQTRFWKTKGYVPKMQGEAYTEWNIELDFKQGRLVSIDVTV